MTKNHTSPDGAGAPKDAHGSRHLDLDELAAAADSEPGDAQKAWLLLASGIGTADVPSWVKDYVRRSASAVAAYDLRNGDQSKLAAALGFWREAQVPLGPGYDLDHLSDWFAARMEEKQRKKEKWSISSIAEEYWEEERNRGGEPGGVRRAYARARDQEIAGIKADMEQNVKLAKLSAKSRAAERQR